LCQFGLGDFVSAEATAHRAVRTDPTDHGPIVVVAGLAEVEQHWPGVVQ